MLPLVPAGEAFGAETGDALAYFVEGFFAAEVALGVEFVGVGDGFFFEGEGEHVAEGKGQVLADDVVAGESGAGVAFADEGVVGEADGAEEVGAEDAVADVGEGAVAVDGGGVGAEDADVVEHGGLGDELAVEAEFGMGVGDGKGFTSDHFAVDDEITVGFAVGRVVVLDDGEWVHDVFCV